jgi:hypothetical protein
MTSLTIVDSEAVVRTWARTEAHISAAVGTKVFFSTPLAYNKAPQSTWIVMVLVAESHEAGDLGLQKPLIQFDCFGSTKAIAATTALAVQTAVRLLSYGKPVTVAGENAVISWADVSLRRWLPDTTINQPRYIVDVLFALHGLEA